MASSLPGGGSTQARCPEYAEQILPLFVDGELIATPKTALDERVGHSYDSDVGREPDWAVADPQRLGGYRIVRELGCGGMGVVYEAFDEKRGAIVALKALKRADPAAILRFKQEFRALADVSHPNLVVLHELTADGPNWFFTMELVDGVDFLSFVRSGDRPASPGPGNGRRPGTAELLVAWPFPIGHECRRRHRVSRPEPDRDRPRNRTLASVEPFAGCPGPVADRPFAVGRGGSPFSIRRGKLHRDLKPSNVLVTRQGRLVILDFGLAADLGSSGLHQSLLPYILGTSSYMAPEQAAGLDRFSRQRLVQPWFDALRGAHRPHSFSRSTPRSADGQAAVRAASPI